jgi:hypothetical protein
MIKRGSKKAISNIEMSVAIILFVVAVFSIILMFNVYYKPEAISYSVLDDFEKSFLEYADNFTKVGFYVTNPGPGCLNITLNDNIQGNNLGVFFENIQSSSSLGVENMVFDSKGPGFYELYLFSFPVKPYSGNCVSISPVYTIPDQGKIFLSSKFSQIALNFNDTNLVIKDDQGIIYSNSQVPPKGAEVLSKTFFILVYDNEKIKNCQVRVQRW